MSVSPEQNGLPLAMRLPAPTACVLLHCVNHRSIVSLPLIYESSPSATLKIRVVWFCRSVVTKGTFHRQPLYCSRLIIWLCVVRAPIEGSRLRMDLMVWINWLNGQYNKKPVTNAFIRAFLTRIPYRNTDFVTTRRMKWEICGPWTPPMNWTICTQEGISALKCRPN